MPTLSTKSRVVLLPPEGPKEEGDICVITGATTIHDDVGTEVVLIKYIPCARDGNPRYESSFYRFENNTDTGVWVVSQNKHYECDLKYVDKDGMTDYGPFSMVRSDHLQFVRRPVASAPTEKPTIVCS